MKSMILSSAFCWLFQVLLWAGETAPAAVTIASPDAIKVLKLESGQPRLYDSNPLRVIEKVSANLNGWQFTSIPQRIVISYKIHVNKTGVIYAFGGAARHSELADRPTREQFLGDDASRWVADDRAIEGRNIGVCFRRKVVVGETIALHAFELQLAAESIAVSGQQANSPTPSFNSASGAMADASQSPSEVLSQQAPNAIEWALAPLNEMVPGDIRQNLTLLRENLLDERAKRPSLSAAAYKLGQDLCNNLIETLNEREKMRVRAGYAAAQSKANMDEVTNQALEARRRFTNWPTYRREKDQREELRKQKENGAELANQRPILEWADRGALIRKTLDALYGQYREAARQPANR